MTTDQSNLPADNPPAGNDAPRDQTAADLVRAKVARAYAEEPEADQELAEAQAASHRSKHQQYMQELASSGKDLAAIQTEWHNYYQKLPAQEKHQVWQEFYASQAAVIGRQQTMATDKTVADRKLVEHKHQTAGLKPQRLWDARKPEEIREAIRHKVTAGGKLQAKHHVQSLLFGLGMGLIVVFIFLFGFFNEVIIAPFIQPSRTATATPLIVNDNSVAPTSTPEVIIPKINVEIPVNYNETSTDENVIENDLQDGIVHYPTTVVPGQDGNTAFFGHSSNNIFNKGKYKFAFVLLHTLVPGDTFYLTYNDKVYAYKVISKTIVDPSDVGVLGPVAGQTATATLITCDPPGTSLHRLIVVGQQISPDTATNTAGSVSSIAAPTDLPGNGPTLWSRVIGTVFGKLAATLVIIALIFVIVLWAYKPRRAKPSF